MNKAEKIEQVDDVAQWQHNNHSEGCYSRAVHAAFELGGVEVKNANDGNRAVSCAPRIFVFDDGSTLFDIYNGQDFKSPWNKSLKFEFWLKTFLLIKSFILYESNFFSLIMLTRLSSFLLFIG